MDDLSASERELIDRLRGDETFRIHIQRRQDGWSVTTAPAPPEQHPQNTGAGDSFAQAWQHANSGV